MPNNYKEAKYNCMLLEHIITQLSIKQETVRHPTQNDNNIVVF